MARLAAAPGPMATTAPMSRQTTPVPATPHDDPADAVPVMALASCHGD